MSRKKLLKKEHLKLFIPVTIGDRINYVAANSGLTGSKFCKKVGISTGNLNGLINDDSNPSAKLCSRLLELYDININWLLSGEGEMIRREKSDIYNKVDMDEDLEISELLKSAYRILKTGNQTAIEYFKQSIKYLDLATTSEDRMKKIEAEMAEVKKRLDAENIKTDRRQKDNEKNQLKHEKDRSSDKNQAVG